MKMRIFVLIMICFMCNVVWAQEKEYIEENEIIEEYESPEPEKATVILPIKKIEGLESGTKFDEKTLKKIQFCLSYAQLANLKSTNINLAIQKNNNEYDNIFKIWLALHGVQEDNFGLWKIDGDKAVLENIIYK